MKRIAQWTVVVLLILALFVCASAAETVYVDPTGGTAGAYTTLESAIAALSNSGGKVTVTGDTTVGDSRTRVDLPQKNGKITVKGENEAVLTLANGILPASSRSLADITVALTDTCDGVYVQGGRTLTVNESVDIRGGKLTVTIGENVQFLNATLTIEVAEGGTAIIESGKYTDIKGEGTIHVLHCAHTELSKGVAVIEPTCTSNGGRYDKCKNCGLHIKVMESDSPIDPTAHDIRWTYGTDSATATCANGCGLSFTQVYRAVEEIHVSSAGTPDGALTAASPINDFGLAMAFAAAQSEDVTVYVHDYAVIPNSGVHSSWNAYVEPAHTNTITVRGYKDQAVLRFNNNRATNWNLKGFGSKIPHMRSG